MNKKNYYLLKIWSRKDGDLVQEKVVFEYEKNISKIKVLTGYRATIETTQEPKKEFKATKK
mgnify:CR=1 FL=1|tara:strand:- start:206 stop:388 length:183 start_codon:yes stop_codon:yes gene_type:complete